MVVSLTICRFFIRSPLVFLQPSLVLSLVGASVFTNIFLWSVSGNLWYRSQVISSFCLYRWLRGTTSVSRWRKSTGHVLYRLPTERRAIFWTVWSAFVFVFDIHGLQLSEAYSNPARMYVRCMIVVVLGTSPSLWLRDT